MKTFFLKKENRGAALFTVILAILFITVLGAALLSTSYLGFAVTAAQKNGQRNFYDAASAMDDVRAYVHGQASDALASAYTETLKKYTAAKSAEGYDAQADFSRKFVAALEDPDCGLMRGGGGTYHADLSTLASQIQKAEGDTAVLTAADDGAVTLRHTGSDTAPIYTAVSLTGLSLRYTDTKGYQSVIISDITIHVPAFHITASVPHSLKAFSIVANHGLTVPAVNASVSGNVYAGSVSVTRGGSVTLLDGDLLCGGGIVVEDGGKLTFQGDSSANITKIIHDIWAGGISLTGDGSSFKTGDDTRTYIQNDLSVLGSADSVSLRGEYTGFGGGTAGTTGADEARSSAILIGGKRAALDFSGLRRLTLAGVSFVNPTTADVTLPIPMGQSVAVKSDQLAYLVPVSCLGSAYPTNPYAYTDAAPALKVYTDTALWPDAADAALSTKTVTDYLGQPVSGGSLHFANGWVEARCSSGTPHIACAFFVFTNQSAANAYFRDYCRANPQNISQYLGYYLAEGRLLLPGSTNTAGVTYSYSNNTLTTNDGGAVSAAGPAALYAGSKGISPYPDFVRDPASVNGSYSFYSPGGELVALVTNGDFICGGTAPSSLRVIVSTGNVEIATGTNFSGVIIAGGSVTVRGTVSKPDTVDWQSWLDAETKDGRHRLSDFLGSGGTKDSGGSDSDSWDLDRFVVYENWKRN